MPRYIVQIAVPKTIYYEVEVEAPTPEIASEAAEGMLLTNTVPEGADVIEINEVDEVTENLDINDVTEVED